MLVDIEYSTRKNNRLKQLIHNAGFDQPEANIMDINYTSGRNKGHFDGSGSRDLTNQIWASADYFQKQMGFSDKEQFLKILYKNINERYKQEGKSMPISETEFSDLLKSRKICYIAGYMTGFKKDAGSFYAKYLTVDMYKRMNDKGYRCITLGIG